MNSASYIAVIIALMFIQGNFAAKKKPEDTRGVFAELKDGLLYTLRTSPIRAPIILLALFGFGGMAYAMLLPVFVKEIGGDANTLGYLSSASALGSVIGTAILATRKQIVGLGRWVIASSFAYAIALLIFGFVHNFWIALPVLALIGAAMMLQMGACNTIIQAIVEENKRGRVMSLFTMAFMGSIPLGTLMGGWIANNFGFHTMVLASAAYCFVVAIGFTTQMPRLRRESRPVYIQRGLIESSEELDVITKPAA